MKKINVISSVLCLLSIELGIADSKAPPINQPIENKVNRGYTNMPKDLLTDRVVLGGGYRQYSPVLRGFTKHDSASPIGKGGINAYNYVHNNPVNAADPTGHVYEPLEYTINPGFNDTNFSRLGSSAIDILGKASDIEQDFETAYDILDIIFGDGVIGINDLANHSELNFARNIASKKGFKDLSNIQAEIIYQNSLKVREAYSRITDMREIDHSPEIFSAAMRSVKKIQPNDIDIASTLSEAVERQNVAEKLYPACCNVTALHYLRTRGTQYVYKHEIALAVSAFDADVHSGGIKSMGNSPRNLLALFYTLVPDEGDLFPLLYKTPLDPTSGSRQMLMFDEAREIANAPGLIMMSDKTYFNPEEPLLSHIAYIEPLKQGGGYTRIDATIDEHIPHYTFRNNRYDFPTTNNRIENSSENIVAFILFTNASPYSDRLRQFWDNLESKHPNIDFARLEEEEEE